MDELLNYTLCNDHLFKIVFEEEKYTRGLLKELGINTDEKLVLEVENVVEDGGLNFKSSNLDLKFKLINEDDISYINMEMQNQKPNYDLNDRLVLYLSKLVTRSQPKGGTYVKCNCIVIGILNYTLFEDNNYIRTLTLNDKEKTEISNYKIILLELTKAEFCDKKELRDWMEIFNAKDLHSYKKEPGILKDLAEKLEQLNKDRIFQSFVDRAEIEAMHIRTEKAYARKEGLAEGRVEGMKLGLAEGRAEGIESEKLAIAKRLKDAGQSIEFIMEITLLDKEIIEKI